MSRKSTLLALLVLMSACAAEALPRVGFEHISLEQGLSQSSVFAITQDHLGFLWFGTQDGLDRYDGYSFKVFRNNPRNSISVSYNYIFRLMVDRGGSVWVGTLGGGVSVYNQAMNDILAGYHGGTPAKYSYSMEQVYSASQLNFDLSLGYTGPSVSASGQFGVSFSNSKTYFAVKLTQQFFTMVYDDPQGPSGVFGPGFTSSELTPYTGAGNPVCYISSVTYGRIYVLIYESTASAEDLSAALNFAYNGGVASGNVQTSADFSKVMSQTTVQVMQIGGDPQAGLDAATALSYDKINAFLTLGADFSPTNIGEPMSYTVKYLKDASLVRMNNVMQYTITQKTPISTSTSYTQSPFNIFISDLSITQNNIAGPNRGCKVVVGVTNVLTGQDSVVWASMINNGAGGSPLYDGTSGWDDFGATNMDAGTGFQLNFTAPQMPVSNPDVSGTFNFTITINGVQLQQ